MDWRARQSISGRGDSNAAHTYTCMTAGSSGEQQRPRSSCGDMIVGELASEQCLAWAAATKAPRQLHAGANCAQEHPAFSRKQERCRRCSLFGNDLSHDGNGMAMFCSVLSASTSYAAGMPCASRGSRRALSTSSTSTVRPPTADEATARSGCPESCVGLPAHAGPAAGSKLWPAPLAEPAEAGTASLPLASGRRSSRMR